jgi:hypothetical protein
MQGRRPRSAGNVGQARDPACAAGPIGSRPLEDSTMDPRTRLRSIVATCAVAATVGVGAQAQDPLGSAQCTAAQARLDAALADASAGRRGARERLAQVRRDAIAACLGSAPEGAERSGAPEPALAVSPTQIGSRVDPLPGPVTTPQASAPNPRPAAITTCDPGGCWDSEGRRLNQLGPVLVGPRGTCTVQAGVVNCP